MGRGMNNNSSSPTTQEIELRYKPQAAHSPNSAESTLSTVIFPNPATPINNATVAALENPVSSFDKDPEKGNSRGKGEDDEKPMSRIDRGLHILGKVFMIFIWIIMTGIMIWYLSLVIRQFIEANSAPNTIVEYKSQNALEMPVVTVCNWNMEDGVLNQSPCAYCNLTAIYCLEITNSADCMNEMTFYKKSEEGRGTFYCWQFNANPNKRIISTSVGYAGGFTIGFTAPTPPADFKNIRNGVQVTFHRIDQVPNLFGEINFVPSKFDGFYALRLLQRTYLNKTTEYNWETSFSMTRLSGVNASNDQFAVSFSYQSLSVQTITDQISYTLTNVFGDLSGMFGTLMGLDGIKLAAGFVALWWSVKKKSCEPLEDVFNG